MSNWGGRRPGAGRPPKPGSTRLRVTLNPVQIEYLIQVARENRLENLTAALVHDLNISILRRYSSEYGVEKSKKIVAAG